ncbi:MAG TPA: TetR family transcriptional regulator, partial [Sphingopyxis sp.]|nr:TetR family transcriptional regulator [Sphingopyxis sp.]
TQTKDKAAAAPKQKRAQITRDKICEATIRLLGQGGAKAVTNRAVAKLAGVSLASTTYHFREREELLTGAFDWLIDSYITSDRSQLDAELGPEPTIDTLVQYLTLVSRQGTDRDDDRMMICAWYEFMVEASRNPEIQATADRWYRETCTHYQQILEHARSRSPADDARRLLDFLIGYEMMSLATRTRPFDRRGIEATYRRFVASLFGPRNGTAEAAR